jgi:putative salt-induced outer membrane protein YdiY
MKSAIVLAFVLLASSVAFAQDAVVELKSGGSVSGKLTGLDRDGATIQEGDKVVRVGWDQIATLKLGENRVPVTAPGPESAPPPAPCAPCPTPCAPCAKPCAPCGPKTPCNPCAVKGKVALSGTVRSGNVDSVLGAFHAEASKEWTEDKLSAAIDALYGKTDAELTAASLGGKTRWDHYFNLSFYSYASVEALYDDIQNLDLRAIVGVGAGDFLWKCNDDQSWAVEGGISALYEDFSTADDPELSPAGRVATIYKNLIFKDVKFEEQLELLVPFTDAGDYLARSRTTLGVPLCKSLALRLSLEITYQGDPPDGTDALDILGLVGVEYQF